MPSMPVQPTAIVEGFRLSPQQRRLWKLQDATPGVRVFSSQLVLLLEGELRSDALRQALEKVCARHESLRMIFRRLPGVVMPVQSLEDHLDYSWRIVDGEELLAREDRHQFDYTNGPL